MAILETKIESGPVRGTRTDVSGVSVFKGIPFAAPPVGENRWKAPMPPAPWSETRDCGTFSPVCPQAGFETGSFYDREFYYALAASPMSEDCLHLNVWTPAESESDRLPVLFWIHGGGFVHGAGSEFPFDGEAIGKMGVILVTFNYRLGVLGFLAHPGLSCESETGTSGNYGILDQVAALDWTRNNIAAFGGDPNRITIFGQSAGAMSVQLLLTSPLSRDKIAGAIAQSGGGLHTFGRVQTLADGEALGQQWMKACGCGSVDELRRKTPDELFAALASLKSKKPPQTFVFRPVIDGYLTVEEPLVTISRGTLPSIPIIAGSMADEANALGGARAITAGMAAGSHSLAALWPQRTGRPAYHYHFDRKAPGDDRGAFHSADLWYLFGTQAKAWRPWEPIDALLSGYMTGYWTNFAKNGDPNGDGLPAWPAFTPESPLSLRIGEDTAAFRMDGNEEFMEAEKSILNSLSSL